MREKEKQKTEREREETNEAVFSPDGSGSTCGRVLKLLNEFRESNGIRGIHEEGIVIDCGRTHDESVVADDDRKIIDAVGVGGQKSAQRSDG